MNNQIRINFILTLKYQVKTSFHLMHYIILVPTKTINQSEIKLKTNGCKVKAICSKEFEDCKYYEKSGRRCAYYEYKNGDPLCTSVDAIDEAMSNRYF